MASKDELERESLENSKALSPRQELFPTAGLASPLRYSTQTAAANGEQSSEHFHYWRTKLGSKLPTLDLPTDRSRSATPTRKKGKLPISFSRDFVQRLTGFANNENVTLGMMVLAGLKAVLHRYSGQEDLLIGTEIGIPLRTAVATEISFRELLGRVRETWLEGHENYCPQVEKLLEAQRADSGSGNLPTFQVVFAVNELAAQPSVEAQAKNGAAPHDLNLKLELLDGEVRGHIEFNAQIFERSTIERFCGHLRTLLEAASTNPEEWIGKLPLLTAAEREQLLATWNATATPYPQDRCVHELFEEQAQRTPDAIAAIFEDKQLSYRELNRRANAVAARLRELGAGPETRVGICIRRSLEMIVGLLGILKSGAAYVPLDPNYPNERLAFMLEDAQVQALLTEEALAGNFNGQTLVCMESLDANGRDENPSTGVEPGNLAYVIYTSGSTGKPKGVMVRHRNAVNFFAGMDCVLGTEPGVWLAVTSICFDISVLELLWTVSRGYKVIIQSDEAGLRASAQGAKSRPDGFAIPAQVRRHHVTHFQCTPSLMSMLLQDTDAADAVRSIDTVLVGGEALTTALVDQLAGVRRLVNVYGPTETTVWSTSHVIEKGGVISIGRPLANQTIYILDKFHQPTPIGIPGELHIGGAGVVRGYLNRPELTMERFIANPFAAPGQRMYRTGDLARYRVDGTIEFLGRLDHQVKLRGFRIELGEIETALEKCEGIREAVVVVRDFGANDKRLVAYIVVSQPIETIQLRRALKQALPDYMVPSAFVFLEQLPLTPNGKVDRKALPDPQTGAVSANGVPEDRAESKQRERATDHVMAARSEHQRTKAEDYWLSQFAAPVLELDLPTDEPRLAVPSLRPGQLRQDIDPALTRALNDLSAAQGATLFTTLLSAYYVLLHRLTGQDDIAVGVPRATGTDKHDLLPLRLQIKPNSSFTEHLASVRDKFSEVSAHGNCSLEDLVRRLGLPRSPNRIPLISVAFTLKTARERALSDRETSLQCDLAFDITEGDEALTVNCTYNAEIFHEATLKRWLGHFQTLLENIAAKPSEAVSRLRLLKPDEWQQLVVVGNRTALDYPRDATIHRLFEEQVKRTPDAIAAVARGQELTYGELNRRANQLAHHLRSLGAKPDMLIGLCVERTFALLVGALGILKAGAAYVPLDWTYPAERLRFMLEDTEAPILVTQGSMLGYLPPAKGKLVCLDKDWEQIAACSTENPEPTAKATDLAYIMYTSGSTGRAKGVGLVHRGAVSFAHWAREAFPPDELARVLASTSICFDLSIFEIFVPLSWGGTVILAENAAEIPTLPAERAITLINTVPSAIKDLLKTGNLPASVGVVNLAGEKLTTRVVQDLYARQHVKKVYDLYGPSEATTYATWTLRRADSPATVGRPLANTQVYILDREMQPVPIGVVGEIYIGGDCLARGYINRAELTAERFIPNPFSNDPQARLYRTGDLGRYLPDGNIIFLGRGDHQVKIRGYRIELGEIDSVLAQHAAVRECVSVVREDQPDQKEIVAYVVTDGKVTGAELRRYLRQRLPDYMVPSCLVSLPALPLLPNGKINRAALPSPNSAAILTDEEPSSALTPTQEVLLEIFRSVLRAEKVELKDDFFDLGGHSVLVTQVVSRVRQAFQVEIGMRHVFAAPTVAALANEIENLLDQQIQAMSAEELQQLASSTALKQS